MNGRYMKITTAWAASYRLPQAVIGQLQLLRKYQNMKVCKQKLTAENKARATINMKPSEAVRYNERSTVERVNGRLKDEFCGRHLRVRGHAKAMCHLMFGIK
jgi:hypothetical protein